MNYSQNKQIEQVEIYLKNEDLLYQDWYKGIHFQRAGEEDPDTIPYGFPFSVENLKKRFERWFNAKKNLLKENICKKWQYLKEKELTVDLIIAIATDIMALLGISVQASLATTTILVKHYLDKLCVE